MKTPREFLRANVSDSSKQTLFLGFLAQWRRRKNDDDDDGRGPLHNQRCKRDQQKDQERARQPASGILIGFKFKLKPPAGRIYFI